MTDYKQLCAELHAAFNTYAVDETHHELLERARAALADGPAVLDGREPASDDDSLALRVQRLEAMRETETVALLDAFKQIDDLKHRIDFHYWKIYQLEEAMPTNTIAPETDD
jgi:hypothetical protein